MRKNLMLIGAILFLAAALASTSNANLPLLGAGKKPGGGGGGCTGTIDLSEGCSLTMALGLV